MVNANPCGGSYTIPKSTPFKLTGSGTDADGHQVYYAWEQYDEDGAGVKPTQGFIGATAGGSAIAPLFRSYPPITSPTRYFPNLNLVAANNYSSSFEPLPSVARTLNFRLTGRDNQTAGGGIHCSALAVNVSSSGPFSVTAPNGGENYTAGMSYAVTWNVNETNAFCTNVNIKLSVDGGASYPYTLLSSTPNDGSQSVPFPAGVANTSDARIMVECADNACVVFFDVSNADFTITSACMAGTSNICPTDAVSLPSGDSGLNFSFSTHYGGIITQQAFNVTAADPNMDVHYHDQNYSGCIDRNFARDYEFIDFVVDATGEYTFSNFYGFQDFAWGNIHTVSGFSTSNPCNSFIASSGSKTSATGLTAADEVTVSLTACTLYRLVVMGFDPPGAGTVFMSGPGNILTSGSAPIGSYSYTYVAVNTSNSQVAAANANGDFTSLPAGSYQVIGASYYSGAGPNPPVVTPASWVGKTIDQIIVNEEDCALFSSNYKPVTVTGGGGCPTNETVSGTIASGNYQASAALTSDGNIPSGNTVTFRAGSSVDLQNNFDVALGAIFDVIMGGCIP